MKNNLTKYLLSTNKQFYVGAMSGHLPKNLQKNLQDAKIDDDFKRENHGYAHFRVDYFDDFYGKNELHTHYYYVVNQTKATEGSVKIRAELILDWINNSSKDIYVLILTDLWGYEIPAEEFVKAWKEQNDEKKFSTVTWIDKKTNKELNVVHKFLLGNDIKKRVYYNSKDDEKLDDYISTSYRFIEKVNYCRDGYRKRIKDDIILLSKEDGSTKQFKSLKAVSDFLGLSYKTIKKHWEKKTSFIKDNKEFEFVPHQKTFHY